jgi:hypothetical protein
MAENKQLTFDDLLAREARDGGLEKAAEKRRELLDLAREIALDVVRREGVVSADEVQAELIRRGHTPAELGNAAGSIFAEDHWEFTGRWRESQRVSNHARSIRVWRLKDVDDVEDML